MNIDKYEDDIIVNVNKKKFFDLMEVENIDFDKVVCKHKSSNEQFHKFNYLVRQLGRFNEISIIDIASHITMDLFEVKDTLECFDEANKYYLRRELADKHGIKMKSNVLKYFLK